MSSLKSEIEKKKKKKVLQKTVKLLFFMFKIPLTCTSYAHFVLKPMFLKPGIKEKITQCANTFVRVLKY